MKLPPGYSHPLGSFTEYFDYDGYFMSVNKLLEHVL